MVFPVSFTLLLVSLNLLISYEPTTAATADCDCPADTSMPVCGTNGVTYDSFCKLRCASLGLQGLGGKCRGKCPCEVSSLMNMICELKDNCPPQIPKGQLCGTDNITYADSCNFLCSQQTKADLGVQCPGGCPCPKADSACSRCPDEYRPLCGNNGITYGNQCMFSCARATNSAGPEIIPVCRTECPCEGSVTAKNSESDPVGFIEHLKRVFLVPL